MYVLGFYGMEFVDYSTDKLNLEQAVKLYEYSNGQNNDPSNCINCLTSMQLSNVYIHVSMRVSYLNGGNILVQVGLCGGLNSILVALPLEGVSLT